MPAPHPPEFRQRAVQLAREGASPVARVAKDLGISQKRQRQAESEAACHLDRLLDSVVITRGEPESVRRSALSLAAMEAAEMICQGAVRPSKTGTAVTAAGVSAGIPEPEAARIVASALHEYGEWADGQRHGAEPSGTEGM